MGLHIKVKLSDGSDAYTRAEDYDEYKKLLEIIAAGAWPTFTFRDGVSKITVNPAHVVAVKCQPEKEQASE